MIVDKMFKVKMAIQEGLVGKSWYEKTIQEVLEGKRDSSRESKQTALKWIGVGAAVTVVGGLIVYGIGTWLAATSLAMSEKHHVVMLTSEIEREESTYAKAVNGKLQAESAKTRRWLGSVSASDIVPGAKLMAYAKCEDDAQKLDIAANLAAFERLIKEQRKK